MWVGQTYYFTWLDGQFAKLEKKVAADGKVPAVWMVHSGGFYAVEKQKSLGVGPALVHWFRWEALMTWLGGMVLLILVYYLGSGLVDPDVADISKRAGIVIGLGALAAGWLIYDAAMLSPLGKSPSAFAIFGLVTTTAAAWGLAHVFSGRAAYIHVGALFGTIMTANVWMRILPATRKMLNTLREGKPPDLELAERAKARTKHNTYMTVPLIFLMISNHFPTATYGASYNWLILCALVLAGAIGANYIYKP